MIKICPKCNKSVDREHANFCSTCGAKLVSPPKCKKCKEQVLPEDVYCTKCGKKNPNFKGKGEHTIVFVSDDGLEELLLRKGMVFPDGKINRQANGKIMTFSSPKKASEWAEKNGFEGIVMNPDNKISDWEFGDPQSDLPDDAFTLVA
ncbi:hypothetical protein A2V71_03425 [Candidatus Berkelbacteria bacterium RBG_13_40_8]|uniref:DZANK-type domain-containing protein n=1 Tax=Candidatus Berkelbacteria bacterium RBG_13_40_8 TaxID=1797467 RepID=A0A1F5DQN6_9BACT|nr:MAG: hypothetical protein A2V71_03425 [Candidatus Berkelbacteria bacterium RBG_13_40_8]